MAGIDLRSAFCTALVLLCFVGRAQQFPVLKYSTSDGLGHQVVYNIHQDKKGLLWFSTDNGLTRYDGKQFKNYTAKDGLGSNFIFGVTDHDTTLLVSTFGGGVHYYDGTRFAPLPLTKLIPYPVKITMFDSSLWVVDRNFDLYRQGPRSYRKFDRGKLIFHYKTKEINNTLWVSSTKQFRYMPEKDSLVDVPIKEIPWPSTSFFSILKLTDVRWLISTKQMIYEFNPKTSRAIALLPGDFSFNSENMLLANDGHVWITETKGRVWRFSPDLKNKQLVFDNVVVNDLYQDADNTIWLATYGQGLWCLPSTYVTVHPLPGLLYSTVFFSKQLNKPLVTSTNEGVYSLDDGALKKVSLLKDNLDQERITCFYEPNHQETIIGTLSWVISKKSSAHRELYLHKAQSAVYKDRNNTYWAGMRMGLASINNTLETPVFDSLFKQRIVRSITEDDKNLLVGTDAGLFIKANTGWQHINKRHGLSNEYVNALLYDSDRRIIWIGTNEGLFSMDAKGVITNRFPNVRCNVLVADNQNNIWSATSVGLLHFSGDSFEVYGEKEGLSSDLTGLAYQPEKHILYVLSSENLFTLSVKGFLSELNARLPTVLLDAQRADSLLLPTKKNTHYLPASLQALAVRFTVPLFKTATNWEVVYKLNDLEWTKAGNNNQLDFYQLPYGNNTIAIRVRDQVNLRASEPLVLTYIVETPFFRKKPVVIIGLTLLATLTAICSILFVRYTHRKKQRKFFEEQRKAELEQKVLRNMLNPHFMNNALSAIQTFVTRNDQRKTLSYLAKFARLMRINLELLEQSTVSLEKELQNLELYLEFEVLRSDGKLSYLIECDASLNQAKLKVPSLVLQPFVENAIWHGILPSETGGCVTITIREHKKLLVMEVSDNGIGLAESAKRKNVLVDHKPSRGQAIIRDRFALLNQQFPGHGFVVKENTKNGSQGTTVRITLPMRY